MSGEPERIWAVFETWHNTEHRRVFASASETNGQEYLRADAALALVAEALKPWVDLACESHGVTGFHLNGDVAEWDELDMPSVPSDALAAREARDKRVRDEALREAAEVAKGQGESEFFNPVRAILALSETEEGE